MEQINGFSKEKSLEENIANFKVYIEPLCREASNKKMFLYNTDLGDWRSPQQLLSSPTTFDILSYDTWELRDINERINELEESKENITNKIYELRKLQDDTY